MKQVKLLSLELTNFKGIKHFKLDSNGANVKVFGDNAAGKTTLFDGFVWLLFNKDSQNKKDFAIKTLTAAGEEMHNLEHTAEGEFLIDGITTTFKKIYKEVWTKKRGAAIKEFTGHTTDHFVDDVPINKKEYTAKVAEIVEEEVFKLLTSPTYFNEQMKWQERRELLLKIAGDVTDEEVINSKKELTKLNDFLSGKSIEDMKKIIASRKKRINDELEKTPVRIDEIVKMTPEATVDVKALGGQVIKLDAEIEELKTQKLNVQNGAAVVEKKKHLQELDMKITAFKRDFESDSLLELHKIKARIQETTGNLQIVQGKLQQAQFKVDTIQRESQTLQQEKQRIENEMAELRNKWTEFNTQQFEYEDKCECPTCKQSLPVEQVEAARNEALARFNEHKSNLLSDVQQQGVTRKERVGEIDERLRTQSMLLDDATTEVAKVQTDIEQKQKDLDKAEQQLEKAQNSVPDVTQSTEYKSLISQKETVQNEIEQLNSSAYEVAYNIDKNINDLTAKKQSINAELAQFANIETNKKRIAELETQQQNLAEEYERLEHQTFLIEEFTRTKVDMLNEKINSKFKYARFKLFDVQVNGALNETCETTFEGVPYGSGLNNAAKINIGLDIINTLSEHFGLSAPIFIDNAEAVTKFIETNTQLISLVVSEQDKQLRVEYDNDLNEFKEAI